MPGPSFVRVINGYPSIDIGAMRHLISIQSLGPTSPPTFDAAGEVTGLNNFATALAAIETLTGKDIVRSGQATTQLLLSIGMWYQPGILPNMQVLADNGSRYLIQSVENILEMNVVLVLNCLGLAANV